MVRTKTPNIRRGQASTSAGTSNGPQDDELDAFRFIHLVCQKRYREILTTKDLIPEKVIQLASGRFRRFVVELERRQWDSLLEEPHEACTRLVREFYANIIRRNKPPQPAECVYVRGRWINVSAQAINQFLRAPVDLGDDYFSLLGEHPDWEEVRQTIGVPESVWTYKKAPSVEPRLMGNKYLNDTARVWAQIMFSHLLPNSHTSSITVEQCLLIYCLMTEKNVNLGLIISDHMGKVHTKNSSLPYPSLITAMAIQQGVPTGCQEEMWPVPKPITAASMLREFTKAATKLENARKAREAIAAPPQVPPSKAAASSSSSDPSLLQLQEQIHALRHDLRSTRATLKNRASRQYSSIYRAMQGLEVLLRQQLAPDLLQQIPHLPPVDPELERLTDEEEYVDEGDESDGSDEEEYADKGDEADGSDEDGTEESDEAEDMEEDASKDEN